LQYERDVEELKKGLENEDIEILNRILLRMEKAAIYYKGKSFCDKRDFFTFEELKEFERMRTATCDGGARKVGDYWQLDNFKLPNREDFEPSLFYYKYELDRLKTVSAFRESKKAIFDVGAFTGNSTVLLRSLFPDNPIYSFEPLHYDTLLEVIKINNLKGIIPVNVGLSDKSGELEIEFAGRVRRCPIITIDDYVKQNNVKVGLIKSDIEGMEMLMLNGALNTIKEQKPILLISIYHNYNDFFKIKPMLEGLELGYKFVVTDANYGYLATAHEVMLNCEVI
jgi:hypothetical protein